MDPAKQREIASRGGKAAHAKGTAHEFTSEEARGAGRKGGLVVSRDRAHMVAIGREGGHMRAKKAKLRLLQSKEPGAPVSGVVPTEQSQVSKTTEGSQESTRQNPTWHPLSA